MVKVIFYEKPGCGGNKRQKATLTAAGHEIEARNLLTQPWTAATLRPFFGDLPVKEWFNQSAPKIKSQELDISELNETEALNLMLAEPLLIRRPLLEIEGIYKVGFNLKEIDAWIGLNLENTNQDIESCPKTHEHKPCKSPV
ncbi:MAG: ArsC/Spx/MgsR family protein [Prochloraceae cyanobacterium]|nr:ArsC/Spx/MgsR family protein [Prochloraceae cyanobacterium]